MLQCYLRERHGAPRHIRLDLYGTDDSMHGEQEGSRYHGFYDQHPYHPPPVFADANRLIVAIPTRAA